MAQKSATYAFIPARRNSKRVPLKNLAKIDGIPLLNFTVRAALESEVFEKVFVNSEDDEILHLASSAGAEVYRRPTALAADSTYVIEVIQEMIHSLRLPDTDAVGVLFPTVPLRSVQDIRVAYKLFCSHDRKSSVVSVTPYEYPIQLALDINLQGRLVPTSPDDYNRSTRHNDHKTMYRANFAIIFNAVINLKAQRNLIGDTPIPYRMPLERSIDIDDPFQMKLVEVILKTDRTVHQIGNRQMS